MSIHMLHAARFHGYGCPKTMLRTWYVDQHCSASHIAEKLSITGPTVLNLLRRYGIEVRGRGGRNRHMWHSLGDKVVTKKVKGRKDGI